jgi:hypothetical protein
VTQRAEASFEITGWDQSVWDDADGAELARVTVRKKFSGDLSGESVAELLTAQIGGNPVEYRGIERVMGTLGGRSGSFVLSHGAGPGDPTTAARALVLPGSGTGELAGLRGTGEIKHGALSLDYAIE